MEHRCFSSVYRAADTGHPIDLDVVEFAFFTVLETAWHWDQTRSVSDGFVSSATRHVEFCSLLPVIHVPWHLNQFHILGSHESVCQTILSAFDLGLGPESFNMTASIWDHMLWDVLAALFVALCPPSWRLERTLRYPDQWALVILFWLPGWYYVTWKCQQSLLIIFGRSSPSLRNAALCWTLDSILSS